MGNPISRTEITKKDIINIKGKSISLDACRSIFSINIIFISFNYYHRLFSKLIYKLAI